MRRFIALTALLACTAASPPPDTKVERFAAPEIKELEGPPGPGETICRDRIHTVRQERGLPELKSEKADPDEPYFIAAVDHRIDGCSVMVMRSDTSDVRPIPRPDDRAPLLRPAQ